MSETQNDTSPSVRFEEVWSPIFEYENEAGEHIIEERPYTQVVGTLRLADGRLLGSDVLIFDDVQAQTGRRSQEACSGDD